jgi:hypothetical protein
MDHIDLFLQKKNIFPVLLKKELCAKIILEETECVVLPGQISFSGKKVGLKINPQDKMHILFHKKKLLERFSQNPTLSFYSELQ